MTEEQIKLFAKCKKSPAFFIENFCFIKHPTKGVIPFKLYEFQKDIVQTFSDNRFVICNKSRQIGLSTITASYALWRSLFNLDQSIIIISIRDDDAQLFLQQIKVAYENLPEWLQDNPRPELNNQHELRLQNGSIIKSVASSTSAGRGRALSLLIIDECSFVENLSEIWRSASPALSRGGSAILISTPNGRSNMFYDIWSKAQPETPKESRNNFKPIFVHWTQVDEYRGGFEITPDMSFKDIVARAEKSDWYRENRPNYTNREWAAEFAGDFISSGDTVIKPEILQQMEKQLRDPIAKYNDNFDKDTDGALWIWELPQPNKNYTAAADVASGSGADYSTVEILDTHSGKQVAEYQGKMDIMAFAEFICKIAEFYNEAYLAPENTGLGIGLIQKIQKEIGYGNLHETKNEESGRKKKRILGWSTTMKTRALIISEIQTYFNSGEYEWYSRRLWKEATSLIWKENGRAEADGNSHDDLIMSLGIAAYLRFNALRSVPYDILQNRSDMVGQGLSVKNPEYNKSVDPFTLEARDDDEEIAKMMDRNDGFDPDDENSVSNWLRQ